MPKKQHTLSNIARLLMKMILALFLSLTIQSASGHSQPSPQNKILLLKADSLLAAASYKKAESTFKHVLKSAPESLRAMRGLSAIAFLKRDWGDVKAWNKKINQMRPSDLQANYLLGIAHRETGKFKALLMRKADFKNSEKYFDVVINSDSSYSDVLYQRALLERHREKWTEAILWGHRQIDVRPSEALGPVGLFKMYRLFLHHTSENDAASWLVSQGSEWRQYFLGELYRKNGRFVEADSIFKDLLQRELPMGKQPIYLSSIRMHVQQGNEHTAHDYFASALDSIQTHLDAQFVFEDCKSVFTDRELEIFESLISVVQKREFFRNFWLRRDPTPAAPRNYRALEHFRRLTFVEENYWYDSVRSRVTSPDQTSRLKYPKAYSLNEELNDKGLIYVRHGEPNDIAKTGGVLMSNESWHYYKRRDRPEYIFHFLIARHAAGNNWRLAPYLSNRQMLADRLGWDTKLDRLYFSDSAVDQISLIQQVASASTEHVFDALSSDSHSWSMDFSTIEMFVNRASFRGTQGKTRVEFHLGIPMAQLETERRRTELPLELGASVLDQKQTKRFSRFESIDLHLLEALQVSHGLFIQRYEVELEPDRYQLSLFAELSNPRKIAGANLGLQVPFYGVEQLMLSDLELAYQIQPLGEPSKTANRHQVILPNPSKEFAPSEPVVLYYELYNLRQDKNGQTSVEIESILTQDKGKKFLGIFGGGKKKSISIRNQVSGAETDSREFTSFNVSKLDPGDYTLTVKAKDMLSGQEVEKSITLRLKKQ